MGRKICTKCKIEKDFSEYHKDSKYLRANCKDCHNEAKRKNYHAKSDYYKKRMKDYDLSEEGKVKRSSRNKMRRKTDPVWKVSQLYRGRLSDVFSGWCRSQSSLEILGCSWEELKNYIELQFKDGMTWENHGYYGWHIDHKIPVASAKNFQELLNVFHYTNLQPLWAEENMAKGARIIDT